MDVFVWDIGQIHHQKNWLPGCLGKVDFYVRLVLITDYLPIWESAFEIKYLLYSKLHVCMSDELIRAVIGKQYLDTVLHFI